MYKHFIVVGCLLFTSGMWALPAAAQKLTREEKLKQDRSTIEAAGQWIYNDLERGFREAKKSNKPLMVVLRCVPCEECVKLDDDLVDSDPAIAELLKEFVRVRQVSTNGLDLQVFQFDTDQSFAVFFLNADGTVYGRFGTRSHRTEWLGDVSIEGLSAAMRGALAIHEQYPQNRDLLVGKQGGAAEVASPEQFPALKEKYDSRWKGGSELVKSCIHCHQIGDARREYYRNSENSIPTEVLYPFPHPKSIGLILDPTHKALVKEVVPGSAAESAGLLAGDRLESLQGQPLLSIADVQWVLHRSGVDPIQIEYVALRGNERKVGQISLDAGWRTADDISWRASSWGLRRMVLGGLVLETADENVRKDLGLKADEMALRIKFVGQYGEHAAGKNAGFQQGDILLSYNDRNDLITESQLLAYGIQNCQAGQKVEITVVRGSEKLSLLLPIQ